MVMAPTPTSDSAVSPCFHGAPAFLHSHFSSRTPPSPPLNPSLLCQQQPSPWDHSTLPKLQLPDTAPSRGTRVPVRSMHRCSKDCLILIPVRLPQISCFSLSLKYFSSDSDNCPDVEIVPLLQFPHLPRAGPGLVPLLFFPLVPSSYQRTWFSIFFSTGQVLLFPFSSVVLHALL